MKPFALLCAFVCSFLYAHTQDTISLKHEQKAGKVYTDRPPQAVYIEAGGSGIVLTANYDKRFQKKTTGLGFRVGLGYSFTSYPSAVTIPVGINYLLGRKSNFFEVGFGETIMFLGDENKDDYFGFGGIDVNGRNSTSIVTNFTVGYRLQPIRGGFNFRVGLTPVFTKYGSAILPYIGFGYNF